MSGGSRGSKGLVVLVLLVVLEPGASDATAGLVSAALGWVPRAVLSAADAAASLAVLPVLAVPLSTPCACTSSYPRRRSAACCPWSPAPWRNGC